MLQCSRSATRTLFSCGLLLSAGLTPAFALDPTGDWQVEGGYAHIRVAECKGNMWGVVAWEKSPGGRDKNNPDPAKQSRPTLGMVSLFDMKKKPNVDVWEGEVYDSQTTGRRWSATLTAKNANQVRLEGCALGFMCSGQTWTRVAPPIPSSPSNGNGAGGSASATKPATAAKPAPVTAAKPKSAAAPKGAAAATPAPGQTPDIGDICLLPEITNATPIAR